MSSVLQLSNVCFSFHNHKNQLLNQITCSFNPGWTALCGVNGSGKTTLLRLLTEELKPSSGSVLRRGSFAFVSQNTDSRPFLLDEFRWSFSNLSIRIRDNLGIVDEWLDRWETLSIGERKKIQIATALSTEPSILILDEPTNHLDMQSRIVILKALKNFKGIGVVVSHDRFLLSTLCRHTFFLESGKLRLFSRPYETARSQFELEVQSESGKKTKLKKEEDRLKRAAQAKREQVERGRRKLSKRGIDPKDRDAREKINRAKLFGADYSDSQKRRSLIQRADSLREEVDKFYVRKRVNLGVFFEKQPRQASIHLQKGSLKREFLQVDYPEIQLCGGDKLALIGDNGVGKTSLMKHWLGLINAPFVYAPQEFSQKDSQDLTHELLHLDQETRGKIFTLISCFGSDPKSLVSGSEPSPGVWQKIMIAKGIVSRAPVLVLDEPTNHMDIAALEILEDALKRYQGILICVSHDGPFIEKVCNMNLEIQRTQDRSFALLDI